METKEYFVQLHVPAPGDKTVTLGPLTAEQFHELSDIPEGATLTLGAFAVAEDEGG